MNRILFKKEGRAKFISHLDLMRTMQRAFIRAGLKIKHTEGFNPHPYMNFALPLSVGTESLCELMDFELQGGVGLSGISERLNGVMPMGITVLEGYEAERKFKEIKWLDIEVRMIYDNGVPDGCADALRTLFSADTLVIEKKTKRATAEVDIIPLINSFGITEASKGVLVMNARVAAQEPALPPAQLMSAVTANLPDFAPDFATFKRLEVLDGMCSIFR